MLFFFNASFLLFHWQRLKALDDGWEDVQKMWEQKQNLLSQSLNLQVKQHFSHSQT